MKLNDYLTKRAKFVRAAQTRVDRMDSGENDASWASKLQDEINMDMWERLEALEALLNPSTE